MLKSENKLEMLQTHLGYLLEGALLEEMAQVAKIRESATDEIIVNVGDQLQMIPIVIEGSIKISRENESGDHLFLKSTIPTSKLQMTSTLRGLLFQGCSSNLKQKEK